MYQSTVLVSETVSQLLSLGGAELTNSRRYVDLTDNDAIRWQSWADLASEYGSTGTAPIVTAWQTIPDDCKADDVLLRAWAVGTGLLTSVNFVEVKYR